MDFNFNDFLGNVASEFKVDLDNPGASLGTIAAKNLKITADKVKGKASSQGSNPPVVAPTQYVKEQQAVIEQAQLELSPMQKKYLMIGAGILAAVVLFKMVK